jgi:RimJ/RimL family protein N-acetyltransferase
MPRSTHVRHPRLARRGCLVTLAAREQSPDLADGARSVSSPYTIEDAEHWVRHCVRALPATEFAIEVEGEASGGIGVVLCDDVERISAELGFWLGETVWGRGVMTDAVSAFVPWAFDRFNLQRIYAHVFEHNPASARVLEKAGFSREARLRRAVIKEGQILDEWLYARVVGDPSPQ